MKSTKIESEQSAQNNKKITITIFSFVNASILFLLQKEFVKRTQLKVSEGNQITQAGAKITMPNAQFSELSFPRDNAQKA